MHLLVLSWSVTSSSPDISNVSHTMCVAGVSRSLDANIEPVLIPWKQADIKNMVLSL